MSTWTSRAVAGLGAVLLASCATAPGLSGRSASEARMMSGGVTLVAPAGYCVDPSSLTQAFALLARCDTLGARAVAGAPIAIMTASFAEAPDTPLPDVDGLSAIWSLDRVISAEAGRDLVLAHVEGTPPKGDLSATHWRGAARIGRYLAAVAVYGPEGSSATSLAGRQLLSQLVSATRARSGTARSTP